MTSRSSDSTVRAKPSGVKPELSGCRRTVSRQTRLCARAKNCSTFSPARSSTVARLSALSFCWAATAADHSSAIDSPVRRMGRRMARIIARRPPGIPGPVPAVRGWLDAPAGRAARQPFPDQSRPGFRVRFARDVLVRLERRLPRLAGPCASRAHVAAGRSERVVPRRDESAHRHLVRDGGQHPSALSRRHARHEPVHVRGDRRPLPRHHRTRALVRRHRRRPDQATQGAGGSRLRRIRRQPHRVALRRCEPHRDRRHGHGRPHGQRRPHRTTRCDDLAQQHASGSGPVVRRASRNGCRRGDARARHRVRAPGRGSPALRPDFRRELRHGRRRPGRAAAVRAESGRAASPRVRRPEHARATRHSPRSAPGVDRRRLERSARSGDGQ